MRTFFSSRTLALFAAIFMVAGVAKDASAAPQELLIDSQNSTLAFKSKTAFADVKGEFDYWTGLIEYDPKAPLNSQVKVTVDAKTINTENRMRDKHLRSDDFFDVERHPEIIFASKKLRQLEGENLYEVTGDLTVRGITREIVFPAEIAVKDGIVHSKAKIAVMRKDFGIKYRSYFNPISNEVEVHFDIRTSAATPTGAMSNSR